MDWDMLKLVGFAAAAVALVASSVIMLSRRAGRAVVEYAIRKGFEIRKRDDGGTDRRLVAELGFPPARKIRRIIEIPCETAQLLFCTRLPRSIRGDSAAPNAFQAGVPRHVIAAFQKLPTAGLSFIAPRLPLSGVGLSVIDSLLRRFFGVDGLQLLDLKEVAPKLHERFLVFTQDPMGARKLLLCDHVKNRLLQVPSTRRGPIIVIAPGGVGVDIEPTLKSREAVELHVGFALGLSAALSERASEAELSGQPPA